MGILLSYIVFTCLLTIMSCKDFEKENSRKPRTDTKKSPCNHIRNTFTTKKQQKTIFYRGGAGLSEEGRQDAFKNSQTPIATCIPSYTQKHLDYKYDNTVHTQASQNVAEMAPAICIVRSHGAVAPAAAGRPANQHAWHIRTPRQPISAPGTAKRLGPGSAPGTALSDCAELFIYILLSMLPVIMV